MITALSRLEMQLVSDAEILLTKNMVINRVGDFFGQLAEKYKQLSGGASADIASLANAKISRGENYRGLPYMMLDYPREFKKPDILAIRSFFWWGHFFSLTLHLSGHYLRQHGAAIQEAINKDNLKDWYICLAATQWEHHFEQDNYNAVESKQYHIPQMPFLKIAKKIPLQEWDEADTFFIENFSLLLGLLQHQAPMR